MDLAKTQFLYDPDARTLQAFRRRRATMMFQGDKPVRLCTMEDWSALKRDYPEEVKQDGLTIRTVWTLVKA